MRDGIGLLVGREWSFPPAFIDAVDRQGTGVRAQYVKVGMVPADEPAAHALIVDRISHEVPYYRSYLKQAALDGTVVINDPFVLDSLDRYVAAAQAIRIGLPLPPTVLLPHRDYSPEIVHEESLRNLDYPLDWQALVERVGRPLHLLSTGWENAPNHQLCESVEELLGAYNASGRKLMMVQGTVPTDHHIRCLVVGDQAQAFPYDPARRKYQLDHPLSDDAMTARIVRDSVTISRAMGLDMNAVTWAVDGNSVHAIDLLDPMFELDVYRLPDPHFERLVGMIVDHAQRLLAAPRLARRSGSARPADAADTPRAANGEPAPSDGAGDLAEQLGSLARGLPESDLT